jgi:hypothetical protein
METNREGHLTDEQFTELLMGTRPAWVQAHLKEYAECCEEAERVSGAIGDFAQQSRLWAERRAAAWPMQAPDRQPTFPWLHRPQAWTAAALAIALVAGIGISLRKEHARPVQPAVAKAQPAATVSPATLKADNELLSAIDGELRADESTPASLYGLDTDSSGGRTKSAKRASN